MIKKFKEYISEGLWKPGIKRSSNNSLRLEDKLNDTNLYDLNGVDWGDFLIADQLLVVDGKKKFSHQELEDLMPYIEKAGWRLMTKEESSKFCKNTTWETIAPDKGEFVPIFVFINLKNQESVRYKRNPELGGIHNFIIEEFNHPNDTYCARLDKGQVGKNRVVLTWIEKTTYAPVILVKDKEKVNEGFWKDGINRSKTGKIREEDKVTNIEKLGTIDMGIDGVLFASDDLTIHGESFISHKILEEQLPYIKSQGWRIPTKEEMIKWFKSGFEFNKSKYEVIGVSEDKSYFTIKSKKTKECLSFPLTELKGTEALYGPITETYWLASNGDRQPMMHLKPKYDNNSLEFFEIMKGNYKPSRVRLVKDIAVNEGLWKPAIQRAKSGEKREEDKIRTNIKDMSPIDIGMRFQIADIDLEVGEEDHFTWSEVFKMYDQILETGWRLPTYEEMERILKKFYLSAERNKDNGDEKDIIFISKHNQPIKREVKLCTLDIENKNFGDRYWMRPPFYYDMLENYEDASPYKDGRDYARRVLAFYTYSGWGKLNSVYMIAPDKPKTLKCRIRLVKDKSAKKK